MKEVLLTFVGVVPSSGERLMGLREANGKRTLVMGIGPAEAASIAIGAGKIKTERPLTHDLLADIFKRFDVNVRRVVIHDLKDQAFIAVLDLETPQGIQEIDCRPSDGVALAVRAKAPIYAAEGVLERAGVDWQELPGMSEDEDWIE